MIPRSPSEINFNGISTPPRKMHFGATPLIETYVRAANDIQARWILRSAVARL